jgi:uncharacterized membrane protein YcaP (DUF421 family)
MFQPSIAIPELIFRVTLVYAGVFLLLRVVGKRHVGELAPFDLVVLLIMSECVQNALIGDDKSVTGGLIAAATLFGINQVVGRISWRNKRAERLLEGTPRVLVRHGRVLKHVLADEQITHSELLEACAAKAAARSARFATRFLNPAATSRSGYALSADRCCALMSGRRKAIST